MNVCREPANWARPELAGHPPSGNVIHEPGSMRENERQGRSRIHPIYQDDERKSRKGCVPSARRKR